MRTPDPADEWLRADAKRRGASLSDYEDEHHIMLDHGPAEQRAKYHEVTAGLVTDDDIRLVRRFERRRLAHRPQNGRHDRNRPIRKAGRFATRAA
jgi:hypothetical protein